MYIKFIINHTAGISAGTVADYDNATGMRLIADGVAEESNKTEYVDYLAIMREVSKNTVKSNAKTRIINLRVENGNITRFEEKKSSDEDADHAISEIEAVKAEYFAKGIELGTSNGIKEGYDNGHSVGHAEGYKLGYDACLAEMANNIFPEPEAEPEITGSQAEIEPVITVNEPVAPDVPDRPKRGRPATK